MEDNAWGSLLNRAQGGSGSGSSDVATQLGRRRARQGVSFEQFTEAVRINFRLFWRALHRVAQPDLVEALTAHELFATTAGDHPGLLEAHYGQRPYFTYDDGEYHLLFRHRQETGEMPTALEQTVAHIRHVPGLGALAAAAGLARKLLAQHVDAGVVTPRTGFSRLVAEGLGDQLFGFEHEVIGRYHQLPEEERQRYAETLEVFLRSGSIRQAAEELYLHRNTVFKRLRSFEEITGLDVSIPQDAVIAMVMLAHRP